MRKYIKQNLSLISFLFIPIVYFWDPNWFGLLGTQPYWTLFWLLPWSIIYGSGSGFIVGLFLGLVLDSISPDNSFTQIPGLVLCGIWFGKFSASNNILGNLKYGLICSLGSLICGMLYFLQILFKNFSENGILFYFASIENILTQVFITGLLAPLLCSLLLRLFKSAKERNILN